MTSSIIFYKTYSTKGTAVDNIVQLFSTGPILLTVDDIVQLSSTGPILLKVDDIVQLSSTEPILLFY